MRALIIDDEELARDNMRIMLTEFCEGIEVVGSAGNIDKAEILIKETNPDVIFLDIRMPSNTEGFDLLNRFDNPDFLVIFVTAFKDYAIKAFNANAIHYLLKPIDIEDLQNATLKAKNHLELFNSNTDNKIAYQASLENATEAIENESEEISKITINHSKGFTIVEVKDIVNLEANGNCTMLWFKDGSKYLDTRTLKIYENILMNNHFYRIHKSHLINLDYLLQYENQDGHKVVLDNGTKLPIARNRLKDFLKMSKELC